MTLTKSYIPKTIHSHYGFVNARYTELVDSVLELIKSTLKSGKDVLISSFGKFLMKNKRQVERKKPSD